LSAEIKEEGANTVEWQNPGGKDGNQEEVKTLPFKELTVTLNREVRCWGKSTPLNVIRET